MNVRNVALAATAASLSFGFSASAQPVSGLYIGAGAGANWAVGAKGNVVGENPADAVARALGAPNAAAVLNAAAAAQQGAVAAQAAAQQAAAQAAAAQAAAQQAVANPLLTAAQRAAAQQANAVAQAAAAQVAAQAAVAQTTAQQAQQAANTITSAQGAGRSAKIAFDVGFVGVGSIGWGFGNGLRAEIEGNYRQNNIGELRLLGLTPQFGGRVRTYGTMANVFYDFDPSFLGIGPSVVQPYLGVGVGYIWTQYDRVHASAEGLSLTINQTRGDLGYQAIAGIAVPLTWLGVRGLSLTAEYRFLGTEQPKVQADLRLGGTTGPVLLSQGFKSADYNHSLLLGVRYAFNQPAPPPPPTQSAPVPVA